MRSIYFAVVATYAWGNLIHYEEIRKHTRMAKITPNDFHDETKYKGILWFRDFKFRDLLRIFFLSAKISCIFHRFVISKLGKYCCFYLEKKIKKLAKKPSK